MEVKLLLGGTWTRHPLSHKGFTRLCLRYLLDEAGPGRTSDGQVAIHEYLTGNVMHMLILPKVQGH